MSNKLTEDKLLELIMEVLQEKRALTSRYKGDGDPEDYVKYTDNPKKTDIKNKYKPSPDPFGSVPGSSGRDYKKALNTIARLDGKPSNLSVGDVYKGIQQKGDVKKVATDLASGAIFKEPVKKADLHSAAHTLRKALVAQIKAQADTALAAMTSKSVANTEAVQAFLDKLNEKPSQSDMNVLLGTIAPYSKMKTKYGADFDKFLATFFRKKPGYVKDAIKSITDEYEAKPSETASDVDASIKTIDPYVSKSITDPRYIGAGVEGGIFDQPYQRTFQSILAKTTLEERLTEFNQISQDMFDVSKIKSMSKQTLVQNILALDYLQSMTFDLDSKRSGGYMFEDFLAMISGGKVSGGDGKAGDFVTSGGQAGSAKYLKKFDIEQSLSGFNVGETVHYINAHKISDRKVPTDKGAPAYRTVGTAKVDEIKTINIHYTLIEVTKIQRGEAHYEVKSPDGSLLGKGKASTTGRQKLLDKITTGNAANIFEKTYIGQLYLRSSDGQILKDFLEEKVEASGDINLQTQKDVFVKLKNYFKKLTQLDAKARNFVNEKDSNDRQAIGNELIDEYDRADQDMVNLLNLLHAGKQVATVKTGARTKLAEKKSKKDLDNLIKEVILKRLLK